MKRWKTLKQFQHVVFTHNPPNYKTNKHKTCWLFGNGHSTYPPCRSRWFVETWGLWFCQSRSSTSPIRMLILWWSVWTYQKLVEYYAYNIHVVEVCCANWIFLAYNIYCKWRVLQMSLKSTLSVFQFTWGFHPEKKHDGKLRGERTFEFEPAAPRKVLLEVAWHRVDTLHSEDGFLAAGNMSRYQWNSHVPIG